MGSRGKQEKLDTKALIKETICELFTDEHFLNTILKKFNDKVDEKTKELETSIKNNEHKLMALEEKIDYLQQNTKINNICIYGIQEEPSENINLKIIQVLNNYSKLNITLDDILMSFRIGQKNGGGKPRPIIVKFSSQVQKIKLLNNCKKFKGTKIFIAEDLTKNRRQLLNKARAALGDKNSWSFNGTIYAKIQDNIVKIKKDDDINKYI